MATKKAAPKPAAIKQPAARKAAPVKAKPAVKPAVKAKPAAKPRAKPKQKALTMSQATIAYSQAGQLSRRLVPVMGAYVEPDLKGLDHDEAATVVLQAVLDALKI